MSRRSLRILISAGEASGDRLGAGLARALLRRRPDLELMGMGGHEMEEAGVRIVQPASEIAVVGIFEVLSHLGAIRRAMRELTRCLEVQKPDLLVPIDSPEFNLRLAARAGRAGVGVVYFVSPQIWAWRPGRLTQIKRLVRRMLVLFPFESRLYQEAGVPVTFVGHPGVERFQEVPDREPLLLRAGLDPARPVVALLPGSRRGEIRRLLPPMLGAARRLRRGRPELQFLVPPARTLPERMLSSQVERSGLEGIRVHSGDYPQILTACAAGAVSSGTASIEAALAGLPAVVVYRVLPLTYLLARLLVRVEHAAMPNLIAGHRVIPELIQGQCNAENIAGALAGFLDDPSSADRVRRGLAEVREQLGPPGAFDRAAEAVLAEAERRPGA